MFSLMSLSKSNFFTQVKIVLLMLHLCRTRFTLVLHSCHTRVVLVSLKLYLCCTRGAFMLHSSCTCLAHVILVSLVSGTSVVKGDRSKNHVISKLNTDCILIFTLYTSFIEIFTLIVFMTISVHVTFCLMASQTLSSHVQFEFH